MGIEKTNRTWLYIAGGCYGFFLSSYFLPNYNSGKGRRDGFFTNIKEWNFFPFQTPIFGNIWKQMIFFKKSYFEGVENGMFFSKSKKKKKFYVLTDTYKSRNNFMNDCICIRRTWIIMKRNEMLGIENKTHIVVGKR